MDTKFWDGTRWQGHLAFNTISHIHVSCYFPAEGQDTCDIMAVECNDGNWYVEDNWGGDAKGAIHVWNPFEPNSDGPYFFKSKESALKHAVSVVATICGVSESELLKDYIND